MRVVVVAILCLAFACALVTTRNVSATLPPLKPGALRVDSPSVLKAETERPKTIVITKPTIVGSAVSEGASSTVPPSTSSEPIVPEGGSAASPNIPVGIQVAVPMMVLMIASAVLFCF